MQMLLDLVLACSFGIASWPFIPVIVLFGSIGLLGYAAVRGLMERAATRAPGASALGSRLESG